jgi:hypothetical protein
MSWEIHRGDNACPWSEQRLYLFDHTGDRMGLQANDDIILLAEFCWIVGAGDMHDVFFSCYQQLQSICAHRRKMRAARDKADIGASPCELNAEIAADGVGAVDADLHEMSPRQRARTRQKNWHHGPLAVRVDTGIKREVSLRLGLRRPLHALAVHPHDRAPC